MTLRILQCSDFHLGKRPDDDDERRMAAVRRHVARLRPDLLVFTGDLVEFGPAGLERGRELLASFGVPFHALPGNHDVGNKVSIGRHAATREMVAAWRDAVGEDRFIHDAASWRIIGLNAQITGTGWREEREQRDRLAEAVACGRPVAVFMHMPLYLYDRDEDLTGRDGYWQVDRAPRRELLPLLERENVRLIASGHVHWHTTFERGARHVWCPSCYSVVREPHYPPGGDVTGMVLHTLGGDGGVRCELVADVALARPEEEPAR